MLIHGHEVEIDIGPSCPNPKLRRQLEAEGVPYMSTSDITSWVGVDDNWYHVYKAGALPELLTTLQECTSSEEEMFKYLESISDYRHEG